MIGTQILTRGTFTQHLVARKYRKNKSRRVIATALMLTSMVDMFSLLVIFLLQSFSTSTEVMNVKSGIILPSAISGASTQDAPVLSISKETVTLDTKGFGSPEVLLQNPEIIILELQKIKSNWLSSHGQEPFKGIIHLEVDREIPSTWVSLFISVLVSQGYGSAHLAVVSGNR